MRFVFTMVETGIVDVEIVILFLLVSKEQQRVESIDPAEKLRKPGLAKGQPGKSNAGKPAKTKQVEVVKIKQLATHELSVVSSNFDKRVNCDNLKFLERCVA